MEVLSAFKIMLNYSVTIAKNVEVMKKKMATIKNGLVHQQMLLSVQSLTSRSVSVSTSQGF